MLKQNFHTKIESKKSKLTLIPKIVLFYVLQEK